MTDVFKAKEFLEEAMIGDAGQMDKAQSFVTESLYSSLRKVAGIYEEEEVSNSMIGIGIMAGELLEISLDNYVIYHQKVCSDFHYSVCKHLHLDKRQVRIIRRPKSEALRDLITGDPIGHEDIVLNSGYGTVGSFLLPTDKKDPVIMISNNHVLADTNQGSRGDEIYYFSNPLEKIGNLLGYVRIHSYRANLLDLAIAQVDVGHTVYYYQLRNVRSARLGERVVKTGATTGTTYGVITSLNYTDKIDYDTFDAVFKDQIQIKSNSRRLFSDGGDSGSAIFSLEDGAYLGLLFAGNQTATLANHGTAVWNKLTNWNIRYI